MLTDTPARAARSVMARPRTPQGLASTYSATLPLAGASAGRHARRRSSAPGASSGPPAAAASDTAGAGGWPKACAAIAAHPSTAAGPNSREFRLRWPFCEKFRYPEPVQRLIGDGARDCRGGADGRRRSVRQGQPGTAGTERRTRVRGYLGETGRPRRTLMRGHIGHPGGPKSTAMRGCGPLGAAAGGCKAAGPIPAKESLAAAEAGQPPSPSRAAARRPQRGARPASPWARHPWRGGSRLAAPWRPPSTEVPAHNRALRVARLPTVPAHNRAPRGLPTQNARPVPAHTRRPPPV